MKYLNVSERPTLRDPVMISAFSGWNDAAGVATAAVQFLVQDWSATKFATIDPEEFYVFTETRPRVRLVSGTYRQIDWPANEFYYHVDTTGSRDYILFVGIEPQLKWKTFSRLMLDMAREYGVTAFVTLGGLLADVAHTMPARLTGSASDPEMLERLKGVVTTGSRYQGPTGITGVLNTSCRDRGLPSASIWGNTPHYLTGMTNPRVTRDILRALGTMLGVNLDLTEFDSAIASFDSQVDEAIARNPEVTAYVRHLEERDREEREETEESDLTGENRPQTDSLLRELEDFLRRRREDGEPDQA